MNTMTKRAKTKRACTKWMEKQRRTGAGLIAAAAALLVSGVCAAQTAAAAAPTVERFSQRLVVTGSRGDPVCEQGSEWSVEDRVCHSAEIAPSAEQRSMVVTASGHAIGSVVVTYDGFGSGKPVLALKTGQCPAGVDLRDGSQEQVGAKAEFVIIPAHGGRERTVPVTLEAPQRARFLREGKGRLVFDLPGLEQPMAAAEPVDLGEVNPGDHIKLRLYAQGSMTECRDGMVRHEPVEARLWGPTSTQAEGYLVAPRRADSWDDTKIAPFKAVATISY
jgi:hypothetical protein